MFFFDYNQINIEQLSQKNENLEQTELYLKKFKFNIGIDCNFVQFLIILKKKTILK